MTLFKALSLDARLIHAVCTDKEDTTTFWAQFVHRREDLKEPSFVESGSARP